MSWRRGEEVRDDRREQEDRARDKQAVLKSLDEQDLWHATDEKTECEAIIGVREARKKLERVTKSRVFFQNGDIRRERVTSKVRTCNRCDALAHWEDECPTSSFEVT